LLISRISTPGSSIINIGQLNISSFIKPLCDFFIFTAISVLNMNHTFKNIFYNCFASGSMILLYNSDKNRYNCYIVVCFATFAVQNNTTKKCNKKDRQVIKNYPFL
jgi:hypothetical protein